MRRSKFARMNRLNIYEKDVLKKYGSLGLKIIRSKPIEEQLEMSLREWVEETPEERKRDIQALEDYFEVVKTLPIEERNEIYKMPEHKAAVKICKLLNLKFANT